MDQNNIIRYQIFINNMIFYITSRWGKYETEFQNLQKSPPPPPSRCGQHWNKNLKLISKGGHQKPFFVSVHPEKLGFLY